MFLFDPGEAFLDCLLVVSGFRLLSQVLDCVKEESASATRWIENRFT
jgi:hypothetical protein